MCVNPVTLKQSREEILEKTGEILPFDRVFSVPCGKCPECLERRREDWTFRLKQQVKDSTYSYFVTMTFDDDHVQKLNKKFLSNYFKRIRNEEKFLKYYAVGEYGNKNHRPHYHAIIFNVHSDIIVKKWSSDNRSMVSTNLGNLYFGDVTDESIHYVTGYLVNKDKDTYTDDDIKPFALMSKGLGKIYLKNATRFCKSKFTSVVNVENGRKVLLPRYYKDRIFTPEERKLIGEQNYMEWLKNQEGKDKSVLREQRDNKVQSIINRKKRRKL